MLVKPVDAKTLAGNVATGRHATEPSEVHASRSQASATGGGTGPAGAANAIRTERR